MKSAVLNCENMRDLSHIVFTRARRDVSSQLLSFALSSKIAFCYMAISAKKHLIVIINGSSICMYLNKYFFNTCFENRTFVHVFRGYMSNVRIDRDLKSSIIYDYLKDIRLEHLTLFIDFPLKHRNEDRYYSRLNVYKELLGTVYFFSKLEVCSSFFETIATSSTAVRLPNLTTLVIHDNLCNMDPKKFTRSTYPVLESLSFHGTFLGQGAIKKLAKFCEMMNRTLETVNVHVKSTNNPLITTQSVIGYLDLFCDRFKKISFKRKVSLNVKAVEKQVDTNLLEVAGFKHGGGSWTCVRKAFNATITYTILVE